ncbi:MAG: efflux RND transporter periplasmic adaptor subunit [Gemmatimonadota bacterium]
MSNLRATLPKLALWLMPALAACGGDTRPPAGEQEMAGVESEGMDTSTGEVDHTQHGAGAPGTREPVMLTAEQERALGVTYTVVRRMPLERAIRTVGRIEAAESAEATVTPKVDGFVEKLLVGTTGESVRRGQPLLTLYSPALVAAQEQLLTALRLAEQVDTSATEAYRSAQAMLSAARRRLDFWDITTGQIDRLIESREVRRTLTLVSPVNGVVLEKPVVEGQRVEPGTLLYRLADLSVVWVEGDVFEQDLQLIREGTPAHIEVSAYPGEHIMGRVAFVYPTVDVQTRTNRVRVTLANPELRLKPGMFVTVFFDVVIGDDVLAVPLDAVIVTGERNLVFVHEPDGTLRPQQVVLGQAAGGHVQILSGLEEGTEVVGSANFLVDAESRLGGSGGMPGMQDRSGIEPDTAAAAQGAGDSAHDGGSHND